MYLFLDQNGKSFLYQTGALPRNQQNPPKWTPKDSDLIQNIIIQLLLMDVVLSIIIQKKKIKKLINKVYLAPSKATSSLYFGKLFILITIDLEIPKLSKNEIVNKR